MNNSYITTELTRIMEEFNKFQKDNVYQFVKNISGTINDFLIIDDYRSYKIYIKNVNNSLMNIDRIHLINDFYSVFIRNLYTLSHTYLFIPNNKFSSSEKRFIERMKHYVESLK